MCFFFSWFVFCVCMLGRSGGEKDKNRKQQQKREFLPPAERKRNNMFRKVLRIFLFSDRDKAAKEHNNNYSKQLRNHNREVKNLVWLLGNSCCNRRGVLLWLLLWITFAWFFGFFPFALNHYHLITVGLGKKRNNKWDRNNNSKGKRKDFDNETKRFLLIKL